jgi:hypothetical protein
MELEHCRFIVDHCYDEDINPQFLNERVLSSLGAESGDLH